MENNLQKYPEITVKRMAEPFEELNFYSNSVCDWSVLSQLIFVKKVWGVMTHTCGSATYFIWGLGKPENDQ